MSKDKFIAEGVWNVNEDINSIWEEMMTHIWNMVTNAFKVIRENNVNLNTLGDRIMTYKKWWMSRSGQTCRSAKTSEEIQRKLWVK
jgi:hypothetical protein